MIKINIICVGKLKEAYWRNALAEYSKRLSAYSSFNVIELAEAPLGDDPSEAQTAQALEKEAAAFEKHISRGYSIALCIEGKQLTSEQLAETINDISVAGNSTINFLIGSSFGLSPRIKSQCRLRLSMSAMTFPHQLARIMLSEQLYRAFSILSHTKYHK